VPRPGGRSRRRERERGGGPPALRHLGRERERDGDESERTRGGEMRGQGSMSSGAKSSVQAKILDEKY